MFRNGVNLVAQADRLMFVEGMQSKSLQELSIPPVAQKYMQALPHADYQAVGINIRGFVPFNQNADAARQYMMNTLLAAGSWQDFGDAPVRTSLNVAYTLGQKRLFLSIAEAALQLPEGETTPILMFSGNFEFSPTAATSAGDRLMQLSQAIENWQQDVETYQDLIHTRFLNPDRTAVMTSTPELLVLSA